MQNNVVTLPRVETTQARLNESATQPRPVRPRTLSRRDSAREASLNREAITRRFEESPFADPPKHKAFGIGPEVITEEHRRLTGRMRLELGRLTTDILETKRKLAIAEHDKNELWTKTVSQRTEIQRLQLQNTHLTTELIDAHKNLEQVDMMFMATREKRISRNITDTIHEIQSATFGQAQEQSLEMARPIIIERKVSKNGR